jgi:glycosyl hydrolase family 3
MVRNRSDNFQGWGSGTAQFPYLIAPLDAIKAQASTDGTVLTTSTSDTPSAGASAAASAATALVFINADSGEGYITVEGNAGDRNNLDPWHNGNDLVAAVAAVNKKTICSDSLRWPVDLGIDPRASFRGSGGMGWYSRPGIRERAC